MYVLQPSDKDFPLSSPMTAVSPPQPHAASEFDRRSAWTLFALGALALVWAFLDTWLSMERVWNGSDTYGHGYLVPMMSIWLGWRMRASLAATPTGFGWLGVPVLAGCAAMWLAGELSGVNSITQLAAVGMISGWALLALGHWAAWRLAFPLAFLFFMVPLGEGLEPTLMEWTADATVASLRLFSIPVYREGLHFMLPSGRWSVVEACSGLRYVIAALLLAILFAHLNYRSWSRRGVFVAAAVAVALVANWVRAWMIVMLGHLSDMRLGVGADHVWYGWAFFGLVMMVVFYVGNRWRDVDGHDDGVVSHVSAPAPWGAGARASGTRVGALAVLATLVTVHSLPERLATTQPHAGYAAEIAAAMGGTPRERLTLEPLFRNPVSEVRGVRDGDAPVEFYSAYYANQRARSELIAFGNTVLVSNDPVWSISRVAAVHVPATEGGSFAVIEYRVHSGARDALVWHWYTVAGDSIASIYQVKLATLMAIVRGRGDHSSVNVLFTRADGDEREARKRLAQAAVRLSAAASRATSR